MIPFLATVFNSSKPNWLCHHITQREFYLLYGQTGQMFFVFVFFTLFVLSGHNENYNFATVRLLVKAHSTFAFITTLPQPSKTESSHKTSQSENRLIHLIGYLTSNLNWKHFHFLFCASASVHIFLLRTWNCAIGDELANSELTFSSSLINAFVAAKEKQSWWVNEWINKCVSSSKAGENYSFVPPVVLLTSTVTHAVPLPTSPSYFHPLMLLGLDIGLSKITIQSF